MANDVVKPVYGSFVPVLKGEKLTMRILVISYTFTHINNSLAF